MKKFILLAGTALLLAGCDQGGTMDDYGTSTGTAGTNYNATPGGSGGALDSRSSADTNQGGATSPGGSQSGIGTNTGAPPQF
ncbi:MAG TPA: lipoprotein [Verrucomicrobia bacterium]|nr:lipoprotein [Verrucomicrobiota bacterium]HOP98989.1 hypothetical protein [Verrucomicrobiota bacterium]HPU56637.1 hypothetical protein [Verrucomicrobiota bacterium]